MQWREGKGSSGILATLSINATYRDLCPPRRGEQSCAAARRRGRRRGWSRRGWSWRAEGMRSPRGVAETTRRAGPARGSWGALPSTFLRLSRPRLYSLSLTPPPFFHSRQNFLRSLRRTSPKSGVFHPLDLRRLGNSVKNDIQR